MNSATVLVLIAILALLNLACGGVLLLRRGVSRRAAQRLVETAAPGAERSAPRPLRRRGCGHAGGWRFAPFAASPLQRLEHLLATSGKDITVQQLGTAIAALAGATLLLALTRLPLVFAAPLGAVCGVGAPYLYIRRARAARYRQIAAQLPDAVDMLARSLKAGHPIPTGIGIIAHELADPIGAEFRLVHEEMTYGLDLKDALAKMGERVEIPEVTYMIVAMRIQAGTGGSLADILNSLAAVIRARQNLYAKVRALSAESRFAGKILGAMPFAVVAMLLLMNPHYYDDARTHPGLAMTLAIAAVMVVVGLLLMRKVVNIRV